MVSRQQRIFNRLFWSMETHGSSREMVKIGYSLCTHIDQILVGRALLQSADIEVRLGQLFRLLWGITGSHRVVCVGIAETRTQRATLGTGVG